MDETTLTHRDSCECMCSVKFSNTWRKVSIRIELNFSTSYWCFIIPLFFRSYFRTFDKNFILFIKSLYIGKKRFDNWACYHITNSQKKKKEKGKQIICILYFSWTYQEKRTFKYFLTITNKIKFSQVHL